MVFARRTALLPMLFALSASSAIRLPGPPFTPSFFGIARPGSRPSSPPPAQPNSTAAFYTALRRDFIFIERFSMVLFRAASRALDAVRDWFARSIGFPPRVMVVTLSGVIAADDEVRYTSQALLSEEADELLFSSVDGGRHDHHPAHRRLRVRGRPSEGLINLERCERQLERAFSAHGARAVWYAPADSNQPPHVPTLRAPRSAWLVAHPALTLTLSVIRSPTLTLTLTLNLTSTLALCASDSSWCSGPS